MTPERDLLERARFGGEALELLIRAIWSEAYRLAFGILRDRGLAEDAAQDACGAIAASLPSLKSLDAFTAWSYRIVVNRALRLARGRKRERPLEECVNAGAVDDRTDAIDLFAAMAQLEPQQRAAVLLHYYAGFTSAEIAAAIGTPASTVRFHLLRARRILHEALRSAPADEETITDVR
jgi:RNA polymerase sigma-70 factor, ECF subfamily